MVDIEYLIIGHPRSGTGYMSRLFQANGYDVGHETMGKHGWSNWQSAIPNRVSNEWGDIVPVREQIMAKNVIYIIRKPIDIINSVAFTEFPSQHIRRQLYEPSDNIFEDAVRSLYAYHAEAVSMKPTLCLKTEFAPLYLGFEKDIPKVYNSRAHFQVSEKDIKHLVGRNDIMLLDFINDYYYSL